MCLIDLVRVNVWIAHSQERSAHIAIERSRKIELFMTHFSRGEPMRYIGKSKISTLQSKPDVWYPLIRLPQQHKHLIGETAQIFITDHESKKGFLILLEETEKGAKL